MKNSKLKESLSLKGDKYSDKFNRLSRKQTNISKVLLVPWDFIDGHESEDGTLYFVSDHSDRFGLSGVPVVSVRVGKYQEFCCVSFSGTPYREMETKDVTEWFIKNYKEFGKCLFDDWSHDWIKINSNSRKCKHCNKHESREVKTIIKRERKEIWKSA